MDHNQTRSPHLSCAWCFYYAAKKTLPGTTASKGLPYSEGSCEYDVHDLGEVPTRSFDYCKAVVVHEPVVFLTAVLSAREMDPIDPTTFYHPSGKDRT